MEIFEGLDFFSVSLDLSLIQGELNNFDYAALLFYLSSRDRHKDEEDIYWGIQNKHLSK